MCVGRRMGGGREVSHPGALHRERGGHSHDDKNTMGSGYGSTPGALVLFTAAWRHKVEATLVKYAGTTAAVGS